MELSTYFLSSTSASPVKQGNQPLVTNKSRCLPSECDISLKSSCLLILFYTISCSNFSNNLFFMFRQWTFLKTIFYISDATERTEQNVIIQEVESLNTVHDNAEGTIRHLANGSLICFDGERWLLLLCNMWKTFHFIFSKFTLMSIWFGETR